MYVMNFLHTKCSERQSVIFGSFDGTQVEDGRNLIVLHFSGAVIFLHRAKGGAAQVDRHQVEGFGPTAVDAVRREVEIVVEKALDHGRTLEVSRISVRA